MAMSPIMSAGGSDSQYNFQMDKEDTDDLITQMLGGSTPEAVSPPDGEEETLMDVLRPYRQNGGAEDVESKYILQKLMEGLDVL